MRLLLALRCFFLVLFARRLPADAVALLPAAPPPTPTPSPPSTDRAGEPAPKASDGSLAAHTGTKPTARPRDGAPLAVTAQVSASARAEESVRGAVQLLSLLQREGRLLDFLQEEIDGYDDAQIGAAVRDIHRGCRRALSEYLPVEPVLPDAENARVRIDAGFDPSRIRLVGSVLGEPPWTGTLRHHGWRTAQVKLPPPAVAADPTVVAPAEVEL
jgi:hypothetical protein